MTFRTFKNTTVGSILVAMIMLLALQGIRGASHVDKLLTVSNRLDAADRHQVAIWTNTYVASRYPVGPHTGEALSRIVSRQIRGPSLGMNLDRLVLHWNWPFVGPLGLATLAMLALLIIGRALPRAFKFLSVLLAVFVAVSGGIAAAVSGNFSPGYPVAGLLVRFTAFLPVVSAILVCLGGCVLLFRAVPGKSFRSSEDEPDPPARTTGELLRWRLAQVAVVAVAAGAMFFFSDSRATNRIRQSQFVIESSVANVRLGPSTRFEIVTQLKKGDTLTMLGTYKEWHKIALPGGRLGWISSTLGFETSPLGQKAEMAD